MSLAGIEPADFSSNLAELRASLLLTRVSNFLAVCHVG